MRKLFVITLLGVILMGAHAEESKEESEAKKKTFWQTCDWLYRGEGKSHCLEF